MRYFNRSEVEKIGRAGSYWDVEEGALKARVLSSFWLYCDPEDQGFTPHMTIIGDGFWESWITKWMSENVAPGSRCIDVGANMGYYSMFLAFHGCQVYSIEPQPHLAALINKSAELNVMDHRVTAEAVAISDAPGKQRLVVPVGHGMNASLAYDPLSPNGYEIIEVPGVTLDDYGKGFSFIKVDVEGAEHKLFRGAQKFIENNPNCVWLIEFRWDRLEEPEQFARELFETMDVSYVDYQGNEMFLPEHEYLATHKNEDWMLVLRRRQ